jgi:3-oxoacyl-[acyl-carrier-protein] synthase-3
MTLRAGIVSCAVQLPSRVVTNDDLRAKYATTVAEMEQHVLGKLWSPSQDARAAKFDEASATYMKDPFRGCVERRWLKEGEKALDLEEIAVHAALERGHIHASDIDAIISCSFFPDQLDVGNGAFLARRLGVKCPAWNVESACSGSLLAVEQAAALVHAGVYSRVLVVTSCTYSRISPEADTLAWGNGDASAALVVARVDAPAGVLGFHATSTHETCGAVWSELDDERRLRMHTSKDAGRVLRETAEPLLRACVDGALSKAGVRASDIDALVVNTPTAWYAKFCCDVLGVDEDRSVNAHPAVANVGPALMPCNLEIAARRGLVRPGATVLFYAVGSVSNAAALVLRCDRSLEA